MNISIYYISQIYDLVDKKKYITLKTYGNTIVENESLDKNDTPYFLKKINSFMIGELKLNKLFVNDVEDDLFGKLSNIKYSVSNNSLVYPSFNQRRQFLLDINVDDKNICFLVKITPSLSLLNYLNFNIKGEISE